MDKGKAKMLEYEDDPSDDNESTHSLDSEFGAFDVPLMRSPGVQKALTSLHPREESSNRFSCNDYMA